MKTAPPAAAAIQATMSNLHLCLAQKACFLTLLAYISHNLHSSLFLMRLYPAFASFLLASPPFPPAVAPSQCFSSSILVGSTVVVLAHPFCPGPYCYWRKSKCKKEYELLFIYLSEGSIHIECSSRGNVSRGELILESFLDLIKKDDSSFDLEGAFSEADI